MENKEELWRVEPRVVRVEDLIPYENNPRDNNDEAVEAVVKSLQKNGYQERILITEDNVIIRGHTRLKAFKKLGWEKVEALVAVGSKGWTDDKIRTVRLVDNRTQEKSLPREKDIQLELRELADQEYAKDLGLEEVKSFGDDTFTTTEEKVEDVREQLESGFEVKEKDKQGGQVDVPCPHCGTKFAMRLKDLKNKVKIKLDDAKFMEDE